MFIRAAYAYDVDQTSIDHSLICDDESLAQQHFAEECDINTIVKRFGVTGELPQGVRMPTYADFDGIFDFQSAANAIASANEAFEQMPADVRYRFNNDPAAFVDFCSDDRNRDEAIRLGLVAVAPSVSAVVAPEGAQVNVSELSTAS